MRSLHVLVVDDEPSNREIAEVVLTNEGHLVTGCNNGQEALDLCFDPQASFDIILMDILMPVLDGLSATRELRANPATRDIPIICVSAKASGSNREEGFLAGCDFYLNKPFRRKDLLMAIEHTLTAKGIPTA